MKRLENFFIMIACVFFVCVRGAARDEKKGTRYLIIQPTRNIGDMVCLTPIMSSIKSADRSAFVAVMGSAKNKELLDDNEDVDEYIEYPTSMFALIKTIRQYRFDSGLLVDFSTRQFGGMFLGGIANMSCFLLISAFKREVPWSFRVLSSMAHLTEYVPGRYIPRQYVRLVAPFGIQATEVRKTLGFSDASQQTINDILKDAGIEVTEEVIAIAPGAGADYKRWPATRFGELAVRLYETLGMPIVIIGGAQDRAAIAEMTTAIGHATRFVTVSSLTLSELKALVGRSSIIIGNDSGALHVSEALGRKTLVVAGATDVNEHFEESRTLKIIRSETAGPLYRSYVVDERTIDRDIAEGQMDSIPVSRVFDVATAVLKTPIC